MENKNLYQRILNISADVKNITKDMVVGSGQYTYKAVSDLAVTLAVKQSEEAHGVVSIPIRQELISSEVYRSTKKESYNGRETEKETFTYVDNIKMTVRFINVDNPSEFIEVETFGKGIDTGDKGFGKASTYARKYALLNAYKIATGDDPDKDASPSDEGSSKVVKAQPEQPKGNTTKQEPPTNTTTAQATNTTTAQEPKDDTLIAIKKRAVIEIKNAKSIEALDVIYKNYTQLHNNVDFEKFVNARKLEITNNKE